MPLVEVTSNYIISGEAQKCQENVEKSTGIVTVLVPVIGYQRATEIAK